MTDELKPPKTAVCEWYDMVKNFHVRFGLAAPDSMHPMLPHQRRYRAQLLVEEIMEFVMSDQGVDQVDALIDLIIFALGTFVEMGIDPREIFDAVHESNMEKLWPDGKPQYDQYGKVTKPRTWTSPEYAIESILKARTRAGIEARKDNDIPF